MQAGPFFTSEASDGRWREKTAERRQVVRRWGSKRSEAAESANQSRSATLANFLSFSLKQIITSFTCPQRLIAPRRSATGWMGVVSSTSHHLRWPYSRIALRDFCFSGRQKRGVLHGGILGLSLANRISRSDPPPFQNLFLQLAHMVRREPVSMFTSMSMLRSS